MSKSSHPSGEVWYLQNTDNTKRACRERCRQHGDLKESEMPSRQWRWKSQKAWGEGRHLGSRGIGNWTLIPRVTQGQVYRLERETQFPGFLTAGLRSWLIGHTHPIFQWNPGMLSFFRNAYQEPRKGSGASLLGLCPSLLIQGWWAEFLSKPRQCFQARRS